MADRGTRDKSSTPGVTRHLDLKDGRESDEVRRVGRLAPPQ